MSRPPRRLALLLGALLSWACERPAPPSEPKPAAAPVVNSRRYFGKPPDGLLRVYFFDVDQGDSALIISPTGSTVLIDAGPASAGTFLANRLPELLTQKLDLVLLTHPHADHYGGLSAAVAAVGARKLLEPHLPHASPDYEALLNSLAAEGVTLQQAASPNGQPLRLDLGGGAELTVLWPRAPAEPLLQDGTQERNSLVVRLTYKHTAVLMMGDAHEQTERKLLESQQPLDATLLKVGAHGSFLATSALFLKAVSPGAAIISTGASAPERAPAREVLGRLEAQKIRVFRTDYDGEVDALSNGLRFFLTPQHSGSAGAPAVAEGFEGHASPAAEPTEPAPSPAPPDAGVDVKAPTATGTPPAPGATQSVETAVARPVDTQAKAVEAKGRGATPAPSSSPAAPKGPRNRPAAEAGPVHYVGQRQTRLFHLSTCPTVRKLPPDGGVVLNSKTEAIAQGFKPAPDCKP